MISGCYIVWLICLFSYKEDTDEATDSDDIIETVTPAAPVDMDEESRETIEKILEVRRGRKGG